MDSSSPAPLLQVDVAAAPFVDTPAQVREAGVVLSTLAVPLETANASRLHAVPPAQGVTSMDHSPPAAPLDHQATAVAPPFIDSGAPAPAARVDASALALVARPSAEGSIADGGYRLKVAAEYVLKFYERFPQEVTPEAFDAKIVANVKTKRFAVPATISTSFVGKACQGRPVHSITKLADNVYQIELNNKKCVKAAPRAMCTPASGYIPLDYVFEIGGSNAADVKSQLRGKDKSDTPQKNIKASKRAREDSESESSEQQPRHKKQAQHAVFELPARPAAQALALDACQMLLSAVEGQSKMLASFQEQQKTLMEQQTLARAATLQNQEKMFKLIGALSARVDEVASAKDKD